MECQLCLWLDRSSAIDNDKSVTGSEPAAKYTVTIDESLSDLW